MAKREDVCEVLYVNEKVVKKIKSQMLKDDLALRLADIFRILGDPTKVKMLHALSKGELCVCDLAALLDMTQSAISHQLRLLRNARIVKFRKEGKMAYYSLADEHVVKLIQMGAEHAEET
ncbi:MAG: ArsR/SmtB family transcription factor [Candidatus Hadarchaeaceae archaeon]